MSILFCARESTLHKRLQEERRRLEINQDEFAEIGGVKRRAQINYESGDRCPDGHYFSAIAAAGADVQYILTGKRSLNPLGDSNDVKHRLYLTNSATDTVGSLGLTDENLISHLQHVLFCVGLGRRKDKITGEIEAEAEGVVDALKGLAGSNLPPTQQALLAAYRKAAPADQAFMERLAQLAILAAGPGENNDAP
jgi:hypothetical protein